ncbi:CPBP family intramembrane glutamic endopeptidase [Culicoidibacter larvae]|nr:CPBP family intramembrane glutamic endopeptidase [Culicoidibacter larvae]
MKFTVRETIALVSAVLCYFVLPIIVAVPVMMIGMMQGGAIDPTELAMPAWTLNAIMIVSFAFLIVLAIVLLIVYRRFLIDEWKKVIAKPLRFVLISIIGIIVFVGFQYIIGFFIPESGANQQLIEDINQQMPWLMGIQAVILAPFVEEMIFRKVLYMHLKGKGQLSIDAFKTKTTAKGGALIRVIALMISSSLLFGLMHFGFGTDPWFMIIPYFTMGLLLVISYEVSQMFYVPVIIHFANNLLSVLMMLFLH